MAGAVQESGEQPAAGQGRSQFTLRDLLVQVGLFSLILALLATRAGIFVIFIPTVVVLSILSATRWQTGRGALIGFVAGCAVGVLLLLSASLTLEAGLLVIVQVLLFGSVGAWIGAATHAFGLKRYFVGSVALFFASPAILALLFIVVGVIGSLIRGY